MTVTPLDLVKCNMQVSVSGGFVLLVGGVCFKSYLGIKVLDNRFVDASVLTALLVYLWSFDPFHDSYV